MLPSHAIELVCQPLALLIDDQLNPPALWQIAGYAGWER
jgi:hypothetical protein